MALFCLVLWTPGLRVVRMFLVQLAHPTPLPPAHPQTSMPVCACLDTSQAPVVVCSVCQGRCAQVEPRSESLSLSVHQEPPHHQALTALLIVSVSLAMVAAIVLSVPTVSGQQEAQKLAARPVAWATHPLLARPALRPVSVLLEGVVPPVLRAQLAPTPLVGHSTHAPAALQAPPLPAPAMMILLIASVSQDLPVPSALVALLVRFALGVAACLQWCARPTPLPQLLPQLCSSVCASPAMVVLQTLHWDVPPAPSVRSVQSAATARAAQQIPASHVVVAGLLLPLDPQVLLPVCARLGLEVPPVPSAQPTPTVLASALMLVCSAQQTLQALLAQPPPVHVSARQALVVLAVPHALLEPSPQVAPHLPPMPLAPAVATQALDSRRTPPLQPLLTTLVFASLDLEVPAALHVLPTPLVQEAALIHV
jgi:hypothetical protein